jgi:hypothetical protein
MCEIVDWITFDSYQRPNLKKIEGPDFGRDPHRKHILQQFQKDKYTKKNRVAKPPCLRVIYVTISRVF